MFRRGQQKGVQDNTWAWSLMAVTTDGFQPSLMEGGEDGVLLGIKSETKDMDMGG